jgi:hypothetical protein
MSSKLSFYLGCERYERNTGKKLIIETEGYKRRFTLKGLGEITVKVLRDRNGEFILSSSYPISLKMELAWRSTPVGKVNGNSPSLVKWPKNNLHKIIGINIISHNTTPFY